MIDIHSKKIRRNFEENVPPIFLRLMNRQELLDHDHDKMCLVWAFATLIHAAQSSNPILQKMQLQGGSASWKVVPDHLDDGVSPNCYSYVWDEDYYQSRKEFFLTVKMMPEVHFWTAIHPDHDPAGKGLIVDLTTKFVPQLAMGAGISVLCQPPNMVWTPPGELPENCVHYTPTKSATIMGQWAINQVFQKR